MSNARVTMALLSLVEDCAWVTIVLLSLLIVLLGLLMVLLGVNEGLLVLHLELLGVNEGLRFLREVLQSVKVEDAGGRSVQILENTLIFSRNIDEIPL